MADKARQIPLDLPLNTSFSLDNFLVGASNEAAFTLLEAWPQWPGPILRLTGPKGSGKSHLASIWAERAGAFTLPASALGDVNLNDLVQHKALVLEECGPEPLNEKALFHLLNLTRETSCFLLLVMQQSPEAMSLQVKDLLSRLRLAPVCTLEAPDDALLKAVLVKLFLDRQLIVDISVVDAIALRIDRSFAKAAEIVAAIDKEALSRGRRITRPIALEILSAQDEASSDSTTRLPLV